MQQPEPPDDPAPERARRRVPVAPMLSMFDPLFIGIDEFGQPVYVEFICRSLLASGEPGGGKSGLLNNIAAHATLSDNTRLVLLDGKLVELGLWADIADEFVGPDLDHAIDVLKRLQVVLNNRYAWLTAQKRRKVTRQDRLSVIVVIIDEIALYSATLGKPHSGKSSTHSSATWSPVAAPAACPSWPPPNDPASTSSPPRCGTGRSIEPWLVTW